MAPALPTSTRARCVFVGMGLKLYYHASQEPFTNVLFANVVGREDLSEIDMAGWNVEYFPVAFGGGGGL